MPHSRGSLSAAPIGNRYATNTCIGGEAAASKSVSGALDRFHVACKAAGRPTRHGPAAHDTGICLDGNYM
ncbi:hypothetical protein SBBP1_50057 [Burkholderiales bacterium]|nr:hypothetical protein SBBP1_50057 [Burkholderiales bacterium]